MMDQWQTSLQVFREKSPEEKLIVLYGAVLDLRTQVKNLSKAQSDRLGAVASGLDVLTETIKSLTRDRDP